MLNKTKTARSKHAACARFVVFRHGFSFFWNTRTGVEASATHRAVIHAGHCNSQIQNCVLMSNENWCYVSNQSLQNNTLHFSSTPIVKKRIQHFRQPVIPSNHRTRVQASGKIISHSGHCFDCLLSTERVRLFQIPGRISWLAVCSWNWPFGLGIIRWRLDTEIDLSDSKSGAFDRGAPGHCSRLCGVHQQSIGQFVLPEHMKQDRNLTMGEAVMLLKHCSTKDY